MQKGLLGDNRWALKDGQKEEKCIFLEKKRPKDLQIQLKHLPLHRNRKR